MAKLVLNKGDKDKIFNAIRQFTLNHYFSSRLGEERESMIAEIQAVATREFFKEVTPDELAVLRKHGCVKNSKDNDMLTISVTCSRSYSTGVEEYALKFENFGYFPSETKKEVMSFRIRFPEIMTWGYSRLYDKAVEAVKRIVSGDMTQNSIAGQLFEICNVMACEIDAILPRYKEIILNSRSWEYLIESAPEVEKMVNPDMIEDIMDDRARVIQKKILGGEKDKQSILFGKEVLESTRDKEAQEKKKQGRA